ncbi:MAG TPA: alpha/beta fold hydrolase [Roseiarcus sp.]|nr:alpha/beta fold hydrolase [Roseiarcus sp.]
MSWASPAPFRFPAGGAMLEGRGFGPPPDEAATIVLLHEGLGSLGLWRDFPEKLARAAGLGVFAYSRRGYGGSDPVELPRPLDYMTREATDVLPDVLNAIGFKRGLLLGHSDGASIAALYLGNRQDHRVRGLILLAPHFFAEAFGLASIAEAKRVFETDDLRARLARHHKDVDGAFWGWNRAWLDPAFKEWNIEEAIDYIRVPVLAIQGRQDQYGTLAQIAALERRLYAPLDKVILDNCGHAAFIDKPQETVAAIAAFVAKLERIEKAEVAVR